jgi:hypothetical protein
MVASDPWTLVIALEDDPDSLGVVAQFRAYTDGGALSDAWELYYPRLEDAINAIERDYGLSPAEWVDLD